MQPRRPDEPQRNKIIAFLNVTAAARDASVVRLTYAASGSTYGDHPGLGKFEDTIGKPLSHYAVTNYVNELYADVFARSYGFATIGLRYLIIFGPRKDPEGVYATALLKRDTVYINGCRENSQDFCCVADAVQANLLSATSASAEGRNQVHNVDVGDRTTLNALLGLRRENLTAHGVKSTVKTVDSDFRPGDVRHSLADLGQAQRLLDYKRAPPLAKG